MRRIIFWWYPVVLLRIGTEYYGWVLRMAINTEGVHHSFNTRYANTHSTNHEDTPEYIGRIPFVDVLSMKFGVFVLLIKRDTNICNI